MDSLYECQRGLNYCGPDTFLTMFEEFSESDITKKTKEAYDFWFNNHKQSGKFQDFRSKGCYMFNNVLPKFSIFFPRQGKVVQLGTALGISFDVLYKQFGDRALGVDLWNPLNHPNIIEKDMYQLEDMPMAFCNINMGDFRFTPKLRMYAIDYAIRNIVKGGVITTAGGDYVNKCLGLDLTKYFTDKGFTISNSRDYYNENSENYSPPAEYVHVDKELIAISS